MLEGILLKGYGGFYFVQVQQEVWECSLRGRFRVKKQDFLPGDHVRILPVGDHSATIEHVYPRSSEMARPPVANVEQVILVFPLTTPAPDRVLLDRILLQALFSGLGAAIVFTKIDLLRDRQGEEVDLSLSAVYRRGGFPVVIVSNLSGEGRDKAEALLRDRISVLAGPSGAGKSSLLNMLQVGLGLKTGAVSEKIGRGRHTTRHVELLPIVGGLVADTPGFSSLHLPVMVKEDLQKGFPEIAAYQGQCRFSGCLHETEPDCAVREAVEDGSLDKGRYKHYVMFLREISLQAKYNDTKRRHPDNSQRRRKQ
ncbi:MAG: ribosome small subunit-dependent GTPase A [Peptococcaceae bacterium]|nr:ribosome small subunit-dependent GTPase A [Peptococcaceae bacterium]